MLELELQTSFGNLIMLIGFSNFPSLYISDEKLFSLRGRALECMGYLAIAVGKDNFRPYFTQSMQCACEGLALDSTELHEFAYAAFANMAKAMESEFSPCLPELVPHLLNVLEQDDGCLEKQTEAQVGNFYFVSLSEK